MSPSTTLATVATGVFSKLRSKPLPLAIGCGRTSGISVTSVPPLGWEAFTGWDCRGKISSERTLSSTSISAVSPLPRVAELHDVSRLAENSMMAAKNLRTAGGYRLGVPTRSMFPPFQLYVHAPDVRNKQSDHGCMISEGI